MSHFSKIPCPTVTLDCIEDVIRDELRDALTDPATADIGDVVGIAQSWWIERDTVRRDACLGYWRVSCHQVYQPTPYRILPSEQQTSLGRAAAHLLDNIYARSVIQPEITSMRKSSTGRWVDAIHTADAILLIEAEAEMDQFAANAARGRLSSEVKLLTSKPQSQHDRARIITSTEALLRGVSGRLLQRTPDADDYCLVPGHI